MNTWFPATPENNPVEPEKKTVPPRIRKRDTEILVKVTEDMAQQIKSHMASVKYKSRSEFMRKAIAAYLNSFNGNVSLKELVEASSKKKMPETYEFELKDTKNIPTGKIFQIEYKKIGWFKRKMRKWLLGM